jgi:preprotein translocase subunit SecF
MTMWPLIKILPVKTDFRFVSFSKYAAVISIIASIASIYLALFPMTPPCGGLNCGIDFKGGTVLEFNTAPKAADLSVIRSTLASQGLGDPQVQAFGTTADPKGVYNVSTRFEPGPNPAQKVEEVKAALTKNLGLGDKAFTRTEVVGPKVSGELFRSGIWALLIAIGLMLLYIWFRFELQFGLGAVVALFHDVLLTFGMIAFFKLEFSLTTVAAILTIIGYSMNDTVVVFDRLRENLRKYKKMPLREVIDLSINETLSRTVITGLTAVVALGGLAIFGGAALFGFSIIMMFGIALGTYSSIYVAAPIILLWGAKRTDEEATPVVLGPASRP